MHSTAYTLSSGTYRAASLRQVWAGRWASVLGALRDIRRTSQRVEALRHAEQLQAAPTARAPSSR